jgi:4-amino-4-deoxy-L-arabinose transferase-like glycosyltransferase
MTARHRWAVALLLAAFILLCLHGLLWDTPTVDEFAHLPAGWYYLKTGSFALFPQNPPLVKLLAALPLVLLHPALDPAARVENTGWYPWVFGTDFMERNRAIYDRVFLLGRLPIVLLGVLTGLLVYRWARELYGKGAGLAALTLYAFCPSIVAHAHLATVDLGAAFFTLLVLHRLERYLRQPTWGRLVLCGLALGAAELAKFTGLLLYPIFVLLVGIAALRAPHPPGPPLPTAPPVPWLRRAAGAGVALILIFLLSLLVIDVGYLFQGVGRPLGSHRFASRSLARVAAALPGRLPVPLPAAYVQGVDDLQRINEVGEYPNYLFGHWSREGFKAYYLITILYKSPLLLLAAFLLAPFASARGVRRQWLLWLPALVLFAAFSLLSRVDYGIRYVLPVLPLACVYAGRLAPWCAARGPALRALGLAALVAYPYSVLQSTPDTLAYFNVLAGGQGDRILLDSNLDWGQGLKRLKLYMDREGLQKIGLAYFGHVDPALYGIRWEFPDPTHPGPAAISANFLHGYPYATYANGRILPIPPGAFSWIGRYPRVAEVGGGMFVYRVGAGGPRGMRSGRPGGPNILGPPGDEAGSRMR